MASICLIFSYASQNSLGYNLIHDHFYLYGWLGGKNYLYGWGLGKSAFTLTSAIAIGPFYCMYSMDKRIILFHVACRTKIESIPNFSYLYSAQFVLA